MTDRILSSRYEQSLDLYFQVYGFSFGEKRNKYLAYKNGSVTTFSEGNDLSFIIINMLEKLGFSADQFGIYAYCELIKEVVYMLNEGIDDKTIFNNLMNKYSELYRKIAKNNGFGTRTYHNYIEDAIAKKNKDCVDKDLAYNIFGDCDVDIYSIGAYYIASYINNNILLYDGNAKIRTLKG